MPHTSSLTFRRELDMIGAERHGRPSTISRRVWAGARIKYLSDSFAQRQAEIAVGVPPSGSAILTGMAGRQIEAMLKDPENDFFVDPASYDKPARYGEAIHLELEEQDYYIEKNVFWVPALARWKTLQDSAKLPTRTEILVKNGKTTTYKISSTGKLVDDALDHSRRHEALAGLPSTKRRSCRLRPVDRTNLRQVFCGHP